MGCRKGILPYGYIADRPVRKGSPTRDVPDGEHPLTAPLLRNRPLANVQSFALPKVRA